MSRTRTLWINRVTAIVIVFLQVGWATVLHRYWQIDITTTLLVCLLYKLAFERAEREIDQ